MPNPKLARRMDKVRAERKTRPRSNRYKFDLPNLAAYTPAHPTSDKIDELCAKRDKTTDHKWRKDGAEKPETIKAIETKAKRIRPKFGKGAYDYATDGDNTGPLRIYVK